MVTATQRNFNIQTRPRHECPLCGRAGVVLYERLRDHLFGAPGEWGLNACANQHCGLVWLDPIPVGSDMDKVYENYHTHSSGILPSTLPHRLYRAVRDGYLQKRMGYTRGVGPRWYRHLSALAFFHPFGRAHVEESAMFLPAPSSTSRLLDVGCGNGFLLARMRDMGWEVEGTEVDPIALEVSRARGVVVRRGDLVEQGYPDDHFDAIHVSHVIEHVEDPVKLVRESYRVLKSGGVLVMRTPNIDSWGHRHFKSDWRGLEPPRHVHLFNRPSLLMVVTRGGFDSDAVLVTTRVTGTISMSNVIRDHRIHQSGSKLIRSLRQALSSLLWVYWERMLLLTAPDIGEEVVVIAKK